MQIVKFVNGNKSEVISHDKTGKVKEVKKFVNGKLSNVVYYSDQDKKVVEYIDSAELEYIDVRQSKVTSYDNNGKVGQVDEFVDGELTKSTEYDKTKEVKSVTEYSSIP
jgi:hypothetical protein